MNIRTIRKPPPIKGKGYKKTRKAKHQKLHQHEKQIQHTDGQKPRKPPTHQPQDLSLVEEKK
jgi:hypothetical protein